MLMLGLRANLTGSNLCSERCRGCRLVRKLDRDSEASERRFQETSDAFEGRSSVVDTVLRANQVLAMVDAEMQASEVCTQQHSCPLQSCVAPASCSAVWSVCVKQHMYANLLHAAFVQFPPALFVQHRIDLI